MATTKTVNITSNKYSSDRIGYVTLVSTLNGSSATKKVPVKIKAYQMPDLSLSTNVTGLELQSGSSTTVQIKELVNTTYSAVSSDAKTTVSVSGAVVTIKAGSYTTSTPVNITITGTEKEEDRTFTKTLTFQLTVLAEGATTIDVSEISLVVSNTATRTFTVTSSASTFTVNSSAVDQYATVSTSGDTVTVVGKGVSLAEDKKVNLVITSGTSTKNVEIVIPKTYRQIGIRNLTFETKTAKTVTDTPTVYVDGQTYTGAAIAAAGITITATKGGSFDTTTGQIKIDISAHAELATYSDVNFTMTVPATANKAETKLRWFQKIGSQTGNSGSKAYNLAVTNLPASLDKSAGKYTMNYTTAATGTTAVICLDPEIAYITDKTRSQLSNQLPYTLTGATTGTASGVYINTRRNGLARIAFISQSSTYVRGLDVYTVQVTGYDESVDFVEEPKVTDKFYVLACMGQSNMVGFDQQNRNTLFAKNPRIAQLGYWSTNLQPVFLQGTAESSQDTNNDFFTYGNHGVHYPLAQKLLANIPDDYGILIVPVAHGNSGFLGDIGGNGIETACTYDSTTKRLIADTKAIHIRTSPAKTWGKGKMLYEMAKDRILAALALNSNNRFLGMVWCQGETDGAYTDDLVTHWKKAFPVMIEDMETSLANVTMFNGTKGFKFEEHAFAFRGSYYWKNRGKYPSMRTVQKSFFGESRFFDYPEETNAAIYGMNGNANADHYGGRAYEDIATAIHGYMVEAYGKNMNNTTVGIKGTDVAATIPKKYFYHHTPAGKSASLIANANPRDLLATTNMTNSEITLEWAKASTSTNSIAADQIISIDFEAGTYKNIATGIASTDFPVVATLKHNGTTMGTLSFAWGSSTAVANTLFYESNA